MIYITNSSGVKKRISILAGEIMEIAKSRGAPVWSEMYVEIVAYGDISCRYVSHICVTRKQLLALFGGAKYVDVILFRHVLWLCIAAK